MIHKKDVVKIIADENAANLKKARDQIDAEIKKQISKSYMDKISSDVLWLNSVPLVKQLKQEYEDPALGGWTVEIRSGSEYDGSWCNLILS